MRQASGLKWHALRTNALILFVVGVKKAVFGDFMMLQTLGMFIIVLAVSASSAPIMTSDVAKERRWADQIVDALIDGEAQWLKAGAHEFLALYTQATDQNIRRAAIILHGIGVHPDWPQVVNPLRIELSEQGWSTLSLQMPVLPNEAKVSDYIPLFDEASPRIEAGVKFLQAQDIQQIVLIGHSLGADMGAYYLARHQGSVKAFIGVGMAVKTSIQNANNAVSLAQISLPVLDLYGSDDLREVLNSSNIRAAAATKAGNKRFTQIQAQGADHFFSGKEDELVKTILTWLLAQNFSANPLESKL